MNTEIKHVVDASHLVAANPHAAALCIANEHGPIVEIMPNADVIIHQEGNLPEAAHRLYAELRRIGAMPMPSITKDMIKEIAKEASEAAAANARVAPQLLFGDIYLTLMDKLMPGSV